MSTKTGLKFLFTEHDGRLFRPTRCWIKPEKGGLESWSLSLTKLVGIDGCPVVDDLKTWMLFEEKDKRHFQFTDPSEQRPYRTYRRAEVLKQYVREVVAGLPEKNRGGPFWLLMPSIADDESYKRYSDTLKEALPGAYILPEPEMVIEYFRLVRRELTLERGRTGIFLVVDVGASTCNFTFVLTRKDVKIVDVGENRRRTARLRAVRGDAAEFAGRWVDRSIMNLLDIDIDQMDRGTRSEVYAAVERAKVRVSESQEDEVVRHATLPQGPILTPLYLEEIAAELWKQLGKVYLEVAARFLAQVQGTEYAQAQIRPLFEKHDVETAKDVQRILDGVILAGGTSLLPGFERSMQQEIFPEAADLKVLRVGRDYPIAAAVGGVAHVLNQQYQPARLHAPASPDGSLGDGDLVGTLPVDIVLGVRGPGAEKAEYTRVLSRSEPFADAGGRREIAGLPPYSPGTELSARLVPGVESQKARIGIKPKTLHVKKAPGRMSLVWNPLDGEARVVSDEVGGVGGLVLNTARLALSSDEPPTKDGDRPSGLWSSGAPDVVIDVGMSKTVAVVAMRGSISVDDLMYSTSALFRMVDDKHISDHLGQLMPAPPSSELVHTSTGSMLVPEPEAVLPPGESVPTASSSVFDIEPQARLAEPSLNLHAASSSDANDDESRVSGESRVAFGIRLQQSLSETRVSGIKDVAADLATLLLALAVRPFVMLAGPPGSGKSTLVRIAARLLDATTDSEFCEVAVLPHWESENDFPPDARMLRETRSEHRSAIRMFLFDEFNLARPERYLMPFFRDLEAQRTDRQGPRILACATLNIDDSSRPPSPKIMDRCFLVEVDAPNSTAPGGIALRPADIDVPPVGQLPRIHLQSDASRPRSWTVVGETVHAVQNCVRERNLRQDLLPSRRALNDIEGILALYEQSEMPPSVLPEDDLVDRVISSRILAKVSGAAEQVEPLIDILDRRFENTGLIRCRRRIDLARSQLQLGFVSPWQ